MLCATFRNVAAVALTATASKKNIAIIKQSLYLKNPLEVIGNPNRPNIFYKKGFRKRVFVKRAKVSSRRTRNSQLLNIPLFKAASGQSVRMISIYLVGCLCNLHLGAMKSSRMLFFHKVNHGVFDVLCGLNKI